MHKNAGARGRRAREAAEIAHGFLGVPAEEFGGVGDLAARVGKRLAVLDRHQRGEPFGVAHDQLVSLAQNLGAIARLARGPALERIACRIDRGLRVLDRGARNRGDLVLGRGIEHIEAATIGSFAPSAPNPEVGRNIRQQILVHVGVPMIHATSPLPACGPLAGRGRERERAGERAFDTLS